MSPHKVDFKKLAWETPIAGVRAKTLKHGGKQVRLVEYTPAMEPHWCEKGHYGYVLEGTFEIGFDGETVIYEAGDGVFIPPGKADRHVGKALTSTVRVVFVEDV
jgi:quercetin dioxygenase-like cupin family protein